jgi:polyisoprenyl-phosphate glycosyltransferase
LGTYPGRDVGPDSCTAKMKKLISVVISAYNEEKVIIELARKLKVLMDRMANYDFEIIIVDHGSSDRTFEFLEKIHDEDKRFKIIQLSRNFGLFELGLTAGMEYSTGDAIVLMAADLQDPPEVVPEFIAKWEQGYEIVYGVIVKRKGVSAIRRIFSPLFYWMMNTLTEGQIPRNATDFRLIDRMVVDQVNRMPEHNRFLRGMIVWTGFRQIGVPYVRAARYAKGSDGGGALKFSIPHRIGLARRLFRFINNAIFSFSTVPLKLIIIVGAITSSLSFLLALYYFIYYLLNRGIMGSTYVKGFTSTILVILFFFGLLFIFMGIIGEYIARIYDEVKGRPLFIVRQTIGFEKKDAK